MSIAQNSFFIFRIGVLNFFLIPTFTLGQEIIRTDLLTNIGASYSPVEWLKVDSSYCVYQKYDSGYSQNSELRRYNKNLSPTKDLVNLNEVGHDFKSVDLVYFNNQILHVADISRNDSVVTMFQSINPVSFVKSSFKIIKGYKNTKTSSNNSKVFQKSPNGQKLCLIELLSGKKTDKLAFNIYEFGEKAQIEAAKPFTFDYPQIRAGIEDMIYSDQGELIVLTKISKSDDYYFELILCKADGQQKLLETIENGDKPAIGLTGKGELYLLKPFSTVKSRLTQGIWLNIYDSVDYSLVSAKFHGFNIDFYLSITNERWHPKIMADQRNGKLLARDRITVDRLIEFDDRKLILGYSNKNGSAGEKVFAFCFDTEMKLLWSDWFVSHAKEIGVLTGENIAFMTFVGNKQLKIADDTDLGFMTMKLTKSGFQVPKKYVPYTDFHHARLKIIASEETDELLFYQLQQKQAGEENRHDYFLYRLGEAPGKYR